MSVFGIDIAFAHVIGKKWYSEEKFQVEYNLERTSLNSNRSHGLRDIIMEKEMKKKVS